MSTTTDTIYNSDYLNPLTARFDAKKSPLALLAATCSSIGRDNSSSKSLIPSLEIKDETNQKDSSNNKNSKLSSEGQSATNQSIYTEHSKKDLSVSSERKYSHYSQNNKDISNVHDSKQNMKSSGDMKPNDNEKNKSKWLADSISMKRHSPSSWITKPLHHNPDIDHHSKTNLITNSSSDTLKKLESPASHLNNYYSGLNEYFAYPYDHAYNLFLHHQALSLNSKSSLGGLHAAANPQSYFSYGHAKNISGLPNYAPVCRDPYCSGCHSKPPSTHSSCAYGCTQCSDKTHLHSSSSSSSGLQNSLRYVPDIGSYNSNSDTGSSSINSSLTPGGLTKPYACNWIAGTEYCGQRFNTSEDLITHLRTHTSSIESHAALYAYYAGLPLTPSGHIPISSNLQYPAQSTSPNSFRRPYSRSLSPTSILSASRYHPYKGQHSSFYPSSNLQSYAAEHPYYSAYSLYGSRLGSVL